MQRSLRLAAGLQTYTRSRSNACCASGALDPAAPGSVNEYHHHILIRLPLPTSDGVHSWPGSWWPSLVEREPAVQRVFRSLAAHSLKYGADLKAKVTVFEYVPASKRDLPPGSCDVIAWPAGLRYDGLPTAEIDAVVAHALAGRYAPQLPAAAQACQVRAHQRTRRYAHPRPVLWPL
jgi:hypothetical protein